MIKLNFKNEVSVKVERILFEGLLRKACEVLGKDVCGIIGDGEVSLTLVGDKQMRELNKDYRGIDKATDVLSFAYLEEEIPQEGEVSIGDIFISIETADRQALEKGHDLEKELSVLFVHGILHLFGFDHGNDEEEKEMEELAEKIL